jgi:hypothetical protein
MLVRAFASAVAGSYDNHRQFTTAKQTAGIVKAYFQGGGRFGAIGFAIGK